MATKPRLVVLTISEATNELFREQLQEVLIDKVIIQGVSKPQQSLTDPIRADLVVATQSLSEEIDDYVASKSEVILARRALDVSTLEKLIRLPAGKLALLVNNTKLATLKTKKLLREVGIDHLELIPYYPQKKIESISEVDLAINLGEAEYIPAQIDKVINIGSRILDLTTIVEVLIKLDLLGEKANQLISDQIKELVQLSKRLNQEMNQLEKTNQKLDAIINHVHDGIIYINEEEEIEVFNQMAEEVFGISAQKVVGDQIKEIISNTNLDQILEQDIKQINALQEVENKQIVTNRVPIKQEGEILGALATFKDITELKKLEQDVRRKLKHKGHIAQYTFSDIVGNSQELTTAITQAKQLATSKSTILIQGESGTGKELFAQAIHNSSDRCHNPFVAINCAALPENLLESELFGYEEGAFTGAQEGGKPGLFEQAHTGTIFLDEVGDIPLKLQTRLLRVLQEKEVMRIGATQVVPIDIRIIAATNKNLRQLVAQGKFRQDLYYRLNVLSLQVPALRYRREDIPALVNYFLTKFKGTDLELTTKVRSRLYNYKWPGNIRELENCIEYVTETCTQQVTINDLPSYLQVEDRSQEKIKQIEAKLSELGTSKEYIFILNELYLAQQLDQNIGRRQIADNAKVNDLYLSSQMVRSRFKKLEEFDLVTIGSGRQGTEITEQGIDFLKKITKVVEERTSS